MNSDANTSVKMGNATFWSMSAEIAAKLISPVLNIILARLIAPESFGIIASINLIVAFGDTMTNAGFQKYLIQHDFRDDDEVDKSASVAFWTNSTIAFLFWLIIFLFRDVLANFVGSEGYGAALCISAISIPLTNISTVQEALLQRELDYKILFYRRIVVSFIPLVVTVPLACLGLEHWALIIGTISGSFAKSIILILKSEWKPRLYFSFLLLKQMLSFGIWTLLEALSMWATSYIDILIISNSLGAYYTGLYKNSQSTVTGIISVITAGTTSVLFSSLSRMKDEEVFTSTFYSFQKKVCIFLIPLGVGIFLYSKLVTSVLLGEQWAEGATFVGYWGLAVSLVAAFGTFCREAYRAKGEPKLAVLAQVIHLLIVIPSCLYSVKYGYSVLIVVRSLAYLTIIPIHFLIVNKKYRIKCTLMFKNALVPFGGSLAMILVTLLSNNLVENDSILIMLCKAFVSGLTYMLFICCFKEYRLFIVNLFASACKNVIKNTNRR